MRYTFIKLLFILTLLFIFKSKVFSQDLGILSSTSPVSGCELSSNESVTVVIFNFGSPFSGSFDVNYQINGGSPITENISIPSFPSFSTFSYTFSTTADLSSADTYEFKFYTSLVGDVNNSNDTLYNSVISDTLSFGGIINTSQSVCFNNNGGVLNLENYNGEVQYWEYSVNNGSSWQNVSNTTDTISYLNLNQETWYRAIVSNPFCPADTSSITVLSIDSLTIGGNITGSTTICVPPNNGVLTLSNQRGTILDWEYSANNGNTWFSLSNNSNSYNYSNQPSTYLYRAIIQNGNCQIEYSDTAEVIVLNGAIGGSTSPSSQNVCSGNNSGNINLSGYSGQIQYWEQSIDNGSNWTTILDTTSQISFNNLSQETWYRAIVSGCNNDTSSIAIVNIENLPFGGNLSSNSTVCEGNNSGIISLSNEIGNIVDWENSIDGGNSWSSIGNTSNSYNFNNLNTTTLYRVIIGNSSCPNAYSDTVTISVDSLPDAGIINGPSNVCSNQNSGSLVVNGNTGNIYDWELSTNNGLSWSSLSNTSNSNTYNNISQTTLYRVIASNGVCPNDTTQITIIADSNSVSGNLFSSDTVCLGSSNLIYLDNYVGDIIDWEYTENNGLSWNSYNYSSDTLVLTNITNQKMHRVFVKNGVCPIDTSNITTLSIYPFNISTSNDTTIESGSSASIYASGGVFYSWSPTNTVESPNDSSTIVYPENTTLYTVSIIDTYGCIYNDSVLVSIEPIIDSISPIIISDLVTANNDGYNDTWNIIGIEDYPETSVRIFNTSGNLLFESNDYKNDWNGSWNGKQLPDGTYYYIIELKTEEQIFKGFVTIVSTQ